MGDGIGDFAFWMMVAVGQVAFWYSMSPVIKALAERVRGRGAAGAGLEARLEALEAGRPITGETDAMYHRLNELEERLDFAERLLAQGRGDAQALKGPS
jgi:hypothetical protein